jgi:hypothetical protein
VLSGKGNNLQCLLRGVKKPRLSLLVHHLPLLGI